MYNLQELQAILRVFGNSIWIVLAWQAYVTPPFAHLRTYFDVYLSGNYCSSNLNFGTGTLPHDYNICLTLSDATGCSSTYCDNSTYINRNETAMITVNAVNTLTGIGETPLPESLVIYPQPAYDKVTVRSAHQVKKAILTNSLGKTILETQPASREFELDISRFAPGIYFLQAETNDGVGSFKVIIGPQD